MSTAIYASPRGRVGEMVLLVWQPKRVVDAPKMSKTTRRTPQPYVWSGIAEGVDASARAEAHIAGAIGIPKVTPSRVRGVVAADISEDFDTVSMVANVTLHDPFGTARTLMLPGNWMHLSIPMEGQLWELGEFYIWEQNKSDTDRDEVRVMAVDLCGRLDRVGKEDRIYRATYPYKIAEEVCKRFGVKVRILDREGTKIDVLQCRQESPYQQIVSAYDQEYNLSGKRFRIRAVGDTIWIYKVENGRLDRAQSGSSILVVETGVGNEGRLGNMISGDMRVSLEGKRTAVYGRGARRVDPNDPTSLAFEFPEVVARSADFARYGPLIETIDASDALLTPSQLRSTVIRTLKAHDDLERKGEYRVPGHPGLRSGYRVAVFDREGTGHFGWAYTSHVSHMINGSDMETRIEIQPNIITPKIRTTIVSKGIPLPSAPNSTSPAPAFGAPPAAGQPGSPYAGPPAPPSVTRTAPGFNEAEMIRIINSYIAGSEWKADSSTGRSPLEGFGAMIVRECKGKMDPRLCVAIGVHEGRLGTYGPARAARNTWGILDRAGIRPFASWEAAIKFFVANLVRADGYYKGLNTVRQIQRRYAPIGAGNDPTNLNQNWITGVTTAMREMGGPSNPDTIVKYKP